MRNIKIPGIYKHFKGALYATSFISEPITSEEFMEKVKTNGGWTKVIPLLINAKFTEGEYYVRVIKIANKYYHEHADCEELKKHNLDIEHLNKTEQEIESINIRDAEEWEL